MVFEISKAPKSKQEFMNGYYNLTEWEENLDYNNPQNTSYSLQSWFSEMILTFPPMNGSLAPTDEMLDNNDELYSHLADYSISTDAIYVGFSWSLAEEAHDVARKLAAKHSVGFLDVSNDNLNIILPDGTDINL